MGLYLCVFEDDVDDHELEGVEIGSYEDFGRLRDTVCNRLEAGNWGSRFPTLMNHQDSDGHWTPEECRVLLLELSQIQGEFRQLPPVPFQEGWQQTVAQAIGLEAADLAEALIDIDGEPLLESLGRLAKVAIKADQRIWFQ